MGMFLTIFLPPLDLRLIFACNQIGAKGATTQCHYDLSYNFFTQIAGYKHFFLFPPNAWEVILLLCLSRWHMKQRWVG
jgi:phage-related protein